MSVSPVYRPHDEPPATIHPVAFAPESGWTDADAYRFEIVSRGDFVPGLLFRPKARVSDSIAPRPASDAVPLVIFQHGLAGSKTAPYLEYAAQWIREGFAVACIDLPLHGERSSPKLSARLIEGIDCIARDEELDPNTFALVEEFARQSTSDLIRTLDALLGLEGIDSDRIGYVGFRLGAIVGSYFLAHDTRPAGAVLALVGGQHGPAELDPARYIDRIAPRPVLVLAAREDKQVPVASSQSLFDAACEPKEFVMAEGDPDHLPGETLVRIQSFLNDTFAR